MRLLVLGGTHFLGRHAVAAALARGHEVTLFNRGRSDPGAFPQAEKLVGDRNGDYAALRGRRWDAVLDPSGFDPAIVRLTCEALAGAVDRYAYVSSVGAYDVTTGDPRLTEASAVLALDAGRELSGEDLYGARKAGCERVVEERFPAAGLFVRPGLIAGPDDVTDRLTYWPRRLSAGGAAIAPGPPSRGIQFIDVRDLAEWIVRALEGGATGVYNATGELVTLGELLATCERVTGGGADVVWADERFLLREGVAPWSELPLWALWPANKRQTIVDSGRARAAGLRLRPIEQTVRDTFEWDARRPRPLPRGRVGTIYVVETLLPEREAELLERWAAVA